MAANSIRSPRVQGMTKDVLIPEIVRFLRGIFKGIHDASKRMERTYGLTEPQLLVLRQLAETQGLTVSDLADTICLHPSTVSGIMARLETKLFVVRTRNPHDHRIVHHRLTPGGRKALRNCAGSEPLEEALGCLSRSKLEDLARSAGALVRALESGKRRAAERRERTGPRPRARRSRTTVRPNRRRKARRV
jgi:DNA-binding MarR family transcriptional regulator